MMTKGFKAGIGTSSRFVPAVGACLGVLVLANFDAPPPLVVDGVPVGRLLGRESGRRSVGSCIVLVALDAHLSASQLGRIARRAGLGLARTGSIAHHGSGEIFLAFAPPARVPRGESAIATVTSSSLDDLFEATVEATEEAVLNALWAAPEISGRDGRIAPALPHDDVLALLEQHGRLQELL
jgi:D-aminopeptidase